MAAPAEPTADELTRGLTYAGFVLLAFELVRDMIVDPIKAFYHNMTFGEGLPFKSWEADVRYRHANEFEACLLYLRDHMEAIDTADINTIQRLRAHRNDLAHDLPNRLPTLNPSDHRELWEAVTKTMFKLSNYRLRMEIGADPRFAWIEDWEAQKGDEFVLFELLAEKVRLLS